MPIARRGRPPGPALSPWAQARNAWHTAWTTSGTSGLATRDPAERRGYKRDPEGYAADILGIRFYKAISPVFDAVVTDRRVLLAGGNNTSKTTIGACIALWVLDCLGGQLDDDLCEVGARVLLAAPDHATAFATGYSEMVALNRRAERRGNLLPGTPSARSVNWKVREQWEVEAFSPPRQTKRKQAHSAAGRHQLFQMGWIMEGLGVPAPVWTSIESTCSSEFNILFSDTNPTEAWGPFYERWGRTRWRTISLDVLDHPNVVQRTSVIPKAIYFGEIDADVADLCADLGRYPEEAEPDPDHHDFLYAVPPKGAEDPRPREDGVCGHADGEVRVYRPGGMFLSNRRGIWDTSGSSRCPFRVVDLDACNELWREMGVPTGPASRLGVDVSKGIEDLHCAAPSWGPDAGELLQRIHDRDALRGQPRARLAAAIEPAYVGRLHILPQTTDYRETAGTLHDRWPRTWWIIERAGGGEQVYDHAELILGHESLTGVYPSGDPPPRMPGEQYAFNFRAAVYLRLATLVRHRLVALPPDPLLREELLAIEVIYPHARVVDGQRIELAQILPKKELIEKLGRSTDRADSVAYSLVEPAFDRARIL